MVLNPNTSQDFSEFQLGFPGCTVQKRAGICEGAVGGPLVQHPPGWLFCQLPDQIEFGDTFAVAVSSRSDRGLVTRSDREQHCRGELLGHSSFLLAVGPAVSIK